MGLEMTADKQAKTAKNKIGDFNVQYNFEHFPGEVPDLVRARGTIEDSNTVVDATYFPATGNFNTVFHHLTPETDVSATGSILNDMRELIKSVAE